MEMELGNSPDVGLTNVESATDRERRPDEHITESDIYHVISNERRRHVMKFLQRANREVHLRELAERVAAWENDESIESVTTQERRRVETALRQFHLPKMTEMGFVHYDTRRKTTRLAVPASAYADYLDPQSGRTYPVGVLCTVFGVASIVVFTVSQLVAADVGVVLASGYLLLLGTVFSLGGVAAAFGMIPSTTESDEF